MRSVLRNVVDAVRCTVSCWVWGLPYMLEVFLLQAWTRFAMIASVWSVQATSKPPHAFSPDRHAAELTRRRREAERTRAAAEALARARDPEARSRRNEGLAGAAGGAEGGPGAGSTAATTFLVEGIVFAMEEVDEAGREVPDPSFTFHTPDKAQSEVRTVLWGMGRHPP